MHWLLLVIGPFHFLSAPRPPVLSGHNEYPLGSIFQNGHPRGFGEDTLPPPKITVLFAPRLPAPPQKPYELNSTRIYLHLDLTLSLRCCPESPLHFLHGLPPSPPRKNQPFNRGRAEKKENGPFKVQISVNNIN